MNSGNDIFHLCWDGEEHVTAMSCSTNDGMKGPVIHVREWLRQQQGWFSCTVWQYEGSMLVQVISLPDVYMDQAYHRTKWIGRWAKQFFLLDFEGYQYWLAGKDYDTIDSYMGGNIPTEELPGIYPTVRGSYYLGWLELSGCIDSCL